jgi:hypothetical protein
MGAPVDGCGGAGWIDLREISDARVGPSRSAVLRTATCKRDGNGDCEEDAAGASLRRRTPIE